MATARDNLARKQIYIPATQPEEEIVLRVAAYCRVSTDSDDQLNSFAAQNAHYNNLIKTHDRWELVDIYADEGITGTSAKKRGDFQRMLEDCRKGKIDKILVKSISRFARNTKDCLEAVRELRTLGISIFFEEHNIDTRMVSSEMLTSVIAACAQAESESISQNMKWSIQKKMQNGTYVASSVPFGFRRINGNLVIEESEARYVRFAFSNYLAGKSTSDIAKEYTAQSAADPVLGSRKWSFQAIVEMLKNEKYICFVFLCVQFHTFQIQVASVTVAFYLRFRHKILVDDFLQSLSLYVIYYLHPGKQWCTVCGFGYGHHNLGLIRTTTSFAVMGRSANIAVIQLYNAGK